MSIKVNNSLREFKVNRVTWKRGKWQVVKLDIFIVLLSTNVTFSVIHADNIDLTQWLLVPQSRRLGTPYHPQCIWAFTGIGWNPPEKMIVSHIIPKVMIATRRLSPRWSLSMSFAQSRCIKMADDLRGFFWQLQKKAVVSSTWLKHGGHFVPECSQHFLR